uniref:DNA methyltransferase n=1 Tax=Algoriphagus sp. TaxID=1872435 RepID=UPI004048362E
MKKVSIGLLRPNTISTSIYGEVQFDNFYSSLKSSIEKEGILEPLVITQDFLIISGVRRYRAALEIGLELVPVVISHYSQDEVDEYLVVSHQQQRVKTPIQILQEIEIITKKYNLVQGRNGDDPMVIQGNKEREKLIKLSSPATLNRLKEAKKTLITHFGDEGKAWAELKRMDQDKKSANAILKEVKNLVSVPSQEVSDETPIQKSGLDGFYKLFLTSCHNMSFLEDGLVDLVFTSPPYYKLRDYRTGKNQFGNEGTVEEYIENLVSVFMECSRIMKNSASMFINIMDSHKNGRLLNVPGKLKQALMDKGLILVSEIIWVKDNPLYFSGNRPQPCYEVIYHFVKTMDYKYYTDWMTDLEFEGQVTYGEFGKKRKLREFWDYRTQVINTSSANNSKLRNLFSELGLNLTHSATMPFEVPNLGVLSTTQKGDIVMDCFNGIGGTAISALSQDRYYIGIDNNSNYIDQTEVRLNQFLKSLGKLPLEGLKLNQAA